MKKILSILAVLTISVVIFSCEKTKLGDAEACINVGDTDYASGKSIYFMNCSQNYSLTKWRVFDNMNNELFVSLSDTAQHLAYTFNPGDYRVDLKVWQATDTTKNSTVSESFTIN